MTLDADLRFDYKTLEKLNEWFLRISNETEQQNAEPSSSEIHITYTTIANQVRTQFSQIINLLTTSEKQETTVAEEWPAASEFSDWASDNCVEFCNSHGIISDLRKCKNVLSFIYTNIKSSSAELDYFNEIESNDDGHVVIRIEIESDRETYKKEYNSWVNWIINNLSDEGRMLISVSIDRL